MNRNRNTAADWAVLACVVAGYWTYLLLAGAK